MRIGVPKESIEGERRVALIPDTVKALTAKDLEVVVESGAGVEAGHPDEQYTDAGAEIGDAWGGRHRPPGRPADASRRSAGSAPARC